MVSVQFVALLCAIIPTASSLSLSVASSGGNTSSPLLYGLLYEDIYHSGDGGLYGELIRNRAFQGSNVNGAASATRNTNYWHPVGGVSLSVDTSSPSLSSSLPYHMRMDVPKGTTGQVGFYNEGFWGFNVDSSKRYISSLYIRGNYSGSIQCSFKSSSGSQLSSAAMNVKQSAANGWRQYYTQTFSPSKSAGDANNTFYFTFDGASLAGQSVYINLLSVFKQTFKDRNNGLREDLVNSVQDLKASWIRLPGGSNLEGPRSPYYWKWNETIGDLKNRPGRLGTWGDINTDGFGLLEMLQMAEDLNLVNILGIFAGQYIDGEIISQASLQPYIDSAMEELEFLLGDASTTFGAERASLGYKSPFTIDYVEIGNEDFLKSGTATYKAYRFAAFNNAIKAAYPAMNTISTINPSPAGKVGSMIDLHIYGNEQSFVNQFNAFDHSSRDYPVFVAEYASIRTGSTTTGQVGAQTFGMACAEAIFLLGCERNSDVIVGSAYGALIKSYNEEPGTVAVIKHTANEILHSTSYYVQQLFAENMGTITLPVTASNGGYGPVYWSATRNSTSTILKLVNYNGLTGSASSIPITFQSSTATKATLIRLSAPASTSVNNLVSLGGEATQISSSALQGSKGQFQISFSKAYEVLILIV